MINDKFACILLSLLCSSLSAATNEASNATESSESFFKTAGIRVGSESGSEANLTSYELYGTTAPQWSWDLCDKVSTGIGYEAAIGVLVGEGDTAAYIHFGVALECAHEDLPVTLVLTTGPSLYSEDRFGDYDMGGNVQLTSSAGLNWQVCENWSIEYRYQHTSNAGLESHNPGLDMHAIGLSHTC